MGRTVAIGVDNFADLREGGYFVVDKTDFIRRWWEAGDRVTLVCRPRRFGKTLTLSMAECFLSTRYAGRGEELFGGMEVWEDAQMWELQGTVPVVSLTFADAKADGLDAVKAEIKPLLCAAVEKHGYLLESSEVTENDRAFLARVSDDMDDVTASTCLKRLCAMLERHWGVRPVVLLDEYDTPMQEAWLRGYWDGMSSFMRSLLNSTFKSNPSLGRGLITGITRVASESIFSDFNNLEVVTVTSDLYADCFGFTEAEVFAAMDEMGLEDRDGVKRWYDGFTFGDATDMYNPWSITHYLKKGKVAAYWANSSSNALAGDLVRGGDGGIQRDFERLLQGETVRRAVDEAVTFRQLYEDEDAAWSLLLAAGYLRADNVELDTGMCDLKITNRETRVAFDKMILGWFGGQRRCNQFARALLDGDVETANAYLAPIVATSVSFRDSGTRPSPISQPERFWHGLVLGLLVDLRATHEVTSNREGGLGVYDVALCPKRRDDADAAVVIEFKVFDERRGDESVEDTANAALGQVRRNRYALGLEERGVDPERVRAYGFGFRGKEALIVGG